MRTTPPPPADAHFSAWDVEYRMPITVLIEPWRVHPLTCIHRAEGLAVARELADAGQAVRVKQLREAANATFSEGQLLLRLSDPVMLTTVRALASAGIPYLGPAAAAMERCYDKYEASRVVGGHSVDVPATALASEAEATPRPLILKPRRGSDSLGLSVLRDGPVPARFRTEAFIAQEFVRGSELTVGVLNGHVGAPLRVLLPEGTPYSFWRKYLWRPRRETLRNAELATRVRDTAERIATTLGVDWAARIDFIHESTTDRLCFLECDVAPLVGPVSAFAASLAASGMNRSEQLRGLLGRN
jgi:D-alanine-D-alanine ligase-like ATP-grasp enzyme